MFAIGFTQQKKQTLFLQKSERKNQKFYFLGFFVV